ncbi:MAG: hypothetical protein JXR84_08470 [Anaerolineae bacterium]|nr:hypothetical protein [Anaerolineae bacterium]
MDIFVELLAKLNWFEKVGAILRLGTPSHKFVVDRNAGWSGRDIEAMLKSYGVKIWGRGFTRDTLSFRAKKTQASWTEYLLFRNRIPVRSKLFYAPNATYHGKTVQRSRREIQRKKRGSIEGIIDFLWN